MEHLLESYQEGDEGQETLLTCKSVLFLLLHVAVAVRRLLYALPYQQWFGPGASRQHPRYSHGGHHSQYFLLGIPDRQVREGFTHRQHQVYQFCLHCFVEAVRRLLDHHS